MMQPTHYRIYSLDNCDSVGPEVTTVDFFAAYDWWTGCVKEIFGYSDEKCLALWKSGKKNNGSRVFVEDDFWVICEFGYGPYHGVKS